MSEARSRICIFPLNPHIAARMWATCWIVERPQSFPGCCAAPSARLCASSTRYAFAAWSAADPGSTLASIDMGPGLRSSATGRCGACHRARIRATRWHRRESAAPRPGHERNLLSLPSGDLPVGRFVDRAVQPLLQKYFAVLVGQIISTNSRHPVPHRGAFRDRHGRRARDAVDAAAFCARWDCRAGSLNS
jgi:hypothetical protein